MTDTAITLSAAERDGAIFMTLDAEPVSDAAKGLSLSLAEKAWAMTGPKKRLDPSTLVAMGSILADVLAAFGPKRNGWVYRSKDRNAFVGERVGYTGFTKAMRGLEGEGFIFHVRGHQQFQPETFGGAPKVGGGLDWSMAARFRATPSLLALAAKGGISPDTWENHFRTLPAARTMPTKSLVKLRAARRRVGRQTYRGARIPVSLDDPKAKALHNEIARLNEYLSLHEIEGGTHRGYQRSFNEGTVENYEWKSGGRLTSVGGDSYQSLKPEARAMMKIDGQPVVELDITACHLAILHGLLGEPFDPSEDLYSRVPGLPREVVKAWVTMAFDKGGLPTRWSDTALESIASLAGLVVTLG